MIDGIRIKVCGLTSLVDAEFADRAGADYLGFILYPKSPRHVSLANFSAMAIKLPGRTKVAVMVEPSMDELRRVMETGFDRFQVHFTAETPLERIAGWAGVVGASRLWLAPKLPAECEVDPAWLEHAQTVLFDTFHAEGFGGSGRTGDWSKFARHRVRHPDRKWVLAGGLSPENVGEALARSGATYIDVNSGVEAAPGLKDERRLRAFVVAVHQARERAG